MLIVDLSDNNPPPIAFATLRRAGFEGVWLKASEGRTWVDETFRVRSNAARAAGLRVGAYHFARPDNGNHPGDEAEHFAAVYKRIFSADLRPQLDLEVGTPHPSYVPWARAWNQEVLRRLGVGPGFYSYPSYIEGLHADTPIGWGLWLASFGRNDGKEHPFSVPAPWRHIVAHQFTSQARVQGVPGPVDVSKVYAPLAVLAFPALTPPP